MKFSLRSKTVLLAVLLDLVRSVARLIDGEVHVRFTGPESVGDPEYQRYLRVLNGILGEQDFIRYLYSLNYDRRSGGFLYAVDAGIAASDKVWVESERFALVLSLDGRQALQVEYEEQQFSSGFDLELDWVAVPLAVEPAAEGLRLLLGGPSRWNS